MDDELTPAERAEIDRVADVLADPSLWAEPPLDLQERVVAAIAEESGSTRRRPWLRYAVGGVAAAVLLAIGVTIGVQTTGDHPEEYAASMTGTDLAPSAKGEVTLTRTLSGWRIALHATGLPRRADGEFYEAWLKNADGVLVPIGTFNDGNDVTLWSGVTPEDFGALTITREAADGNQASSGEVVLLGKPHPS